MLRNARLKRSQFHRVSVEEVEHVLRRSHRSLDAAQWVAPDEVVNAGIGNQQLIGRRGEALAQSRGLRWHVVRTPGDCGVGVCDRQTGQALECRNGLVACEQQGFEHLQLLDVLGEIPRGHAEMDELMSGQVIEFLDACLHIVLGDPLASRDGIQVDLVDYRDVLLNCIGRDGESEFGLRAHDRDPQLPFHDDLGLGRPDRAHGLRCVPTSKDIGERGRH